MNGRDEPYQSIDCSHHDRLEAAIVTRQNCVLTCRDGTDGVVQYTGRVIDLISEGGEEFVVTEHAERIRLDRIVDLDGVSFR